MAELAQAVDKVKGEMDANKANTYIQVVGGFLLKQLDEEPALVDAVMVDGKTILKSLDAMRKEAQKKQSGGVAILTDAEGFAIVLDYFKKGEPAAKAPEKPKSEDKKKSDDKPKTDKPKADKPKQTPPPEPEPEPVEEPDDEFDFDSLLD